MAADRLPEPHLWLGRPFSAEYRQWAAQNYPYGSRGGGGYVLHTGMDIGNPMGTPLLALADGQVAYAGSDATEVYGAFPNYYGQLIVLQLAQPYGDQPLFALYGHVSEIFVQSGQIVQTGERIGAVGMTGIALGPHLHFEVRVGENSYYATRNPEFWLRPLPGLGVLVGRLVDKDDAPIPQQPVLIYKQSKLSEVWVVLETYPEDREINPDDHWQENFLFADVPAGDYLLEAGRFGAIVRQPFQIEPDRITFIQLQWRETE